MVKNGRFLHLSSSFTYPLDQGRIFLISVGKAALPMAQAAWELLSGQYPVLSGQYSVNSEQRTVDSEQWGVTPISGLIVTKHPSLLPPHSSLFPPPSSPLPLLYAAHPISDETSLAAGTAVKQLLQSTTPNDLVLCLISGGTSALLTHPLIPLPHWQTLCQVLLASGCTIQEFNTVRRHLDEVKGGGLARWAAPAICVSLILSDVVGNPLPSIGSGPTIPSTDTPADALSVLERYNIAAKLETAVWHTIQEQLQVSGFKLQGSPNLKPETLNLKPRHFIVGDVRQAAQAVADKATELGYTAQLLTTQLEGEAREIGRFAAALAKDAPVNHCYILGGESTVTLRGQGWGGRNQEIALAAAIALDGCPQRLVASFATDGEDGPTPAAGAWATGETVKYGRSLGLDPSVYLQNNDSYSYFEKLSQTKTAVGGHIHTGPTATNVNDILIIGNKLSAISF